MSKRNKSSKKHTLQSRPETSIFSALPINALAGAAIIAVAVFLVYIPSINGGFLLDDDLLLSKSSFVRTFDGLWRYWCTADTPDYWPLSNTTLWIEWRL